VVLGTSDIERRHLVRTGVRAGLEGAGIVLLYFVVPISHHRHALVFTRLAVAIALLGAVLAYEVSAITRARHPMLRAAVAMALLLPLFVIVFAWTYLTVSLSTPSAFDQHLDRVSAIYFAVTVFSTVGFGDIVPRTDSARLIVTAQMLGDLAFIALGVRLLFGAARGALEQRDADTEPGAPE
jgi:voltage-gated potassium channel